MSLNNYLKYCSSLSDRDITPSTHIYTLESFVFFKGIFHLERINLKHFPIIFKMTKRECSNILKCVAQTHWLWLAIPWKAF